MEIIHGKVSAMPRLDKEKLFGISSSQVFVSSKNIGCSPLIE